MDGRGHEGRDTHRYGSKTTRYVDDGGDGFTPRGEKALAELHCNDQGAGDVGRKRTGAQPLVQGKAQGGGSIEMCAKALDHGYTSLIGREDEGAAHRAVGGTMGAAVPRVRRNRGEGNELQVGYSTGEDSLVTGRKEARREKVEAGR